MNADTIETVFNSVLGAAFCTRVIGGAAEPLYVPAAQGEDCSRIYYRQDYVSSALHEIAHWCIAGRARRQLADYGYWYESERSADSQRAFESMEAKPQALEWIMSEAGNIAFQVSLDNFDLRQSERNAFRGRVRSEALNWLSRGLPTRAAMFVDALVKLTGRRQALVEETYRQLPR